MIEIAKQAAFKAGEILTEHYGEIPADAVRKKSATDLLSFVDETAEKTIIEYLKDHYPDHKIYAEESGHQSGNSEYQWIIDPLDGTTNYLHQIPVFAVSIGLQQGDELILGVVYNPQTGEMFSAEKGNGAFLNGQPIRVSDNTDPGESLIATGFPFKSKEFLPQYLQAFENILSGCRGMRRVGSAAMDMVYLACGRFDAFWELGLEAWDIAAGTVIIREAGGHVTDFWNNQQFLHNNYILASNGQIHAHMLEQIQKPFPFYEIVYK